MSNTAPYSVNVTGTDDETFAFTVPFEMADGTAFPFSDYEIEYSVHGQFILTQGNGITITAPNVEFKKPDGPLCKGTHEHGCRVRHIASGDVFQVFDGTVTIGEGNF